MDPQTHIDPGQQINNFQPEQNPKRLNFPFWVWVVVVTAILGLGGYFIYQHFFSETITVLDSTDQWQTYHNEELGFSFKYPRDYGEMVFSINSGETGEMFYGNFSKNPDIQFGGITYDYTAGMGGQFIGTQGYTQDNDKYYFNFVADEKIEVTPSRFIQINEGADEALVIEDQDMGLLINPSGKGALINLKDDRFSGIGFIYYNIPQDETYLFDDIISSFKFIEPTDTSNWQTYRNEEYRFEVLMPGGWYTSEEYYQNIDQQMIRFSNYPWGSFEKSETPEDFLAFFISTYPKYKEDDYEKIKEIEEEMKEFSNEKFEYSIENKWLINLYVISERTSQKDNITWDVILPYAKAFLTGENYKYYFYPSSPVPTLDKGQEKELDILRGMLKSFKFIKLSNLSDEEIYQNNEYKIRFEKPFLFGRQGDVREKENKIFVCLDPSTEDTSSCQYVEIFEKSPGQTLKEAIEEQFLKSYPSDKCWFEEIRRENNPKGYQYATISYPTPWYDNRQYCPSYSAANGVSYFMMDPRYPDRFVYFSIGQYYIGTRNRESWQDTFEFID